MILWVEGLQIYYRISKAAVLPNPHNWHRIKRLYTESSYQQSIQMRLEERNIKKRECLFSLCFEFLQRERFQEITGGEFLPAVFLPADFPKVNVLT